MVSLSFLIKILFSSGIRERPLVHRDEIVDRVLVLTLPVGNLLAQFVGLLEHLLAAECHLGLILLVVAFVEGISGACHAGDGGAAAVGEESRVNLFFVCLLLS